MTELTTRLCQMLAVAALLITAVTAEARTHKFAVVLGNNNGHRDTEALRYAEEDARKLFDTLIELSGVKRKNATLLLGADADQAWEALYRVEKQIAETIRETGGKALLIFFFSGHSNGHALEMGQTSLRLSSLLTLLRESSADVRVALIDACKSGRLTASKGGKRGPDFEFKVTDEIDSEGYAIITSSGGDELSHESTEIRGAYFTHYLVSALRGAGDISDDGRVTLSEAYDFAYRRTLARTSAILGGGQHPTYDYKLQGRGDIVLTHTAAPIAGISVQLPESGRLLLLDESGEILVAETTVEPDEEAGLAVGPGEYLAYLLTQDNLVRRARAQVSAQSVTRLGMDNFETVELRAEATKGGLFTSESMQFAQRFGVGGVWRRFGLMGGDFVYGVALDYRIHVRQPLYLAARLSWASAPDIGRSENYHEFGGAIGPGLRFGKESFGLLIEILGGYEHLVQFKEDRRHSSGFSYQGRLGGEVVFADAVFLQLIGGVGGRGFKDRESGMVHLFDWQIGLGVGVVF